MQNVLYGIAIVLIFGAIIAFHEAGHFFVAKLSRMKVHEFALGLGPRLFGIRRGDTDYALRAIPVGGMVQVAGMEPEDPDPAGFNTKPLPARIAVIAAGPLMNVILAAIIFCISFTVFGVAKNITPEIARVIKGKSAAAAGLLPGDRFLEINGVSAGNLDKMQAQIRAHPEQPITVVVARGGKRLSFRMTPDKHLITRDPVYDNKGELIRVKKVRRWEGQLGVVFGMTREHLPIGQALTLGMKQTWGVFAGIIKGFTLLFQGRVPADVSGPVGIITMLYDQAQVSWLGFLDFAGMISVMIAFFNLVPFPALDGSRIAFLLLEAIRRRPIDPHKEALVHNIGLIILLLFILVITVGDVWRRWGPQ
jgi:regulator of sigma E protease